MKIYISADIEGITGISHWDEAGKSKPEYQEFRQQMTREVLAACEGAIAAGATDILIKDAHGSGRNIIADELPDCARLIRGWSGNPLSMVQELNELFYAVLMIGYHSRAGAEGNPLAHTLSLKDAWIKINDNYVSEFLLHTYAAALFGVPVAFVSGDEGLCRDIAELNENIRTLAVSRGVGASTISIAPKLALRQIREHVAAALQRDLSVCAVTLPQHFTLEVRYRDPVSAYGCAFYPGASHSDEQTVRFETTDYFEVLRALKFIV
jgi:D-amino peptidase